MKPWHSAWWPRHPRACALVAALLAVAAGAVYAEAANAASASAPTTYQVTHRVGQVADRMLTKNGMRVAGILGVSCRPGTRSDPTRRVRWWCLLEQHDEVGAVNWRTRIRLRWHRDVAPTSVDWRMRGTIRMSRPSAGHLTSERF